MRNDASLERPALVARIQADPSIDARLEACLRQPDFAHLEVAVRHLAISIAYFVPVTAVTVWLVESVWTMGALAAFLVVATLGWPTVQSIVTAVLSAGRIPGRLVSRKGRRGYGWFLLATLAETLEAAVSAGSLYVIAHTAEWWGLLT